MLVSILKFFHLLFVLGLLGSTIYCLFLIGSKKFALANTHLYDKITSLNKALLGFGLLAMITGSMLVYPKHFTFQTHWIQAAHLLITGFILSIATLLLLRKKISAEHRGVCLLSYATLLVVLIILIHDAVTKTTFIL
jgi:hypothetical protein